MNNLRAMFSQLRRIFSSRLDGLVDRAGREGCALPRAMDLFKHSNMPTYTVPTVLCVPPFFGAVHFFYFRCYYSFEP